MKKKENNGLFHMKYHASDLLGSGIISRIYRIYHDYVWKLIGLKISLHDKVYYIVILQ